jgi:hypothetical protein
MKRKRILFQFTFVLFALALICSCATDGTSPAPGAQASATVASGPGKSVTDWPSGVTVNMPDKTFKGYTLYASLSGDGTVNLIDMKGKVVHTWKMANEPGMYGFLLDNGNLLYSGRTPEGYGSGDYHMSGKGGVLVEADWKAGVVTKVAVPNSHHDMDKMPNGNYLTTLWEPVPKAKLALVKGGVPGTEFPDGTIFEEIIAEFNPQGQKVWSWRASDHLSFDEFPIDPCNDRLEWLHVNSVEYLPADNPITKTESIMLSMRHPSACIIFEKSSGKLQWRYGGYMKGEYGRLGCQHDFQIIKKGLPGEGNILVFDNGMNLPSVEASTAYWGIAHSRVIEINPQTKKVIWMYEHKDTDWNFPGVPPKWKFNSPYIAGAQRLPNGNTLICEGATGRIFEVTTSKEIVWEFINPDRKAVFRAYRYAPNHPAFAGKGLPQP